MLSNQTLDRSSPFEADTIVQSVARLDYDFQTATQDVKARHKVDCIASGIMTFCVQGGENASKVQRRKTLVNGL